MKQGVILYDPMPIGRMGIRRDNHQVIIANDYSCFAQMVEEYISYGAIKIAIPKSAPELKTIDQMPLMLKNRVFLIDDSQEREALRRVLFNLRKEFDIKINDEVDYLNCPKDTDRQLFNSIIRVHDDFKKMALGFNHGIQTDINTEISLKAIRVLRKKVSNAETRLILADLEALFNRYVKIEFEGVNPPKDNTPGELINIFDRLINDDNYLEYSDSIQMLSMPHDRDEVLLRLRKITRLLKSKNYIAEGWDYIVKILGIWPGLPLPESKSLANIFNDKALPSFVNMENAKQRAIEMWRSSSSTNMPLRRDGLPIANEEIIWLPVLNSMKVTTSHNRLVSLGTLGELKEALEKIQGEIDK